MIAANRPKNRQVPPVVTNYQGYEYGGGYTEFGSTLSWLWKRNQPFSRFWHVPSMRRDSRLSLCMKILKGMATTLSRFYIDDGSKPGSPSPMKEFLIDEVTRFWTVGAPQVMDCWDWGWAGCETCYRYDDEGMLRFNYFQKFRAQDVWPVTMGNQLIGLEVYRNAAKQYLGGQRGFWTVHDRHHNPWWGESKYEAAYIPWSEMYETDGALDMERAYYFRESFQGLRIRYPDQMIIHPETGQEVHASVWADEMVQKYRAGKVFSLPSERDADGNYLWDIEDPQKGQTNHDVREYVEDLRRRQTEGMGVSEEIFQAAETGSGFSGRKIPETAVRGILTGDVYWLMHDATEQIFKPTCKANGFDDEFCIVPFGLIEEDQPVGAEGVPGEDMDTLRDPNKGNGLRMAC